MGQHARKLEWQALQRVGKLRGGASQTREKKIDGIKALARFAADAGCQRIDDLKTKHIDAFFAKQRELGLSASDIANKATAARTLAEAIGKANIVDRGNERYGGLRTVDDRCNPQTAHVENLAAVRAALYQRGEWLGLAFDMRAAFGLRAKESLLSVRVERVDGRDVLQVNGAKGGRSRSIAISDEQRAVVAAVRDYLERTGQRSLCPAEKTLQQAYDCQKNAVSRSGGTKAEGANMHVQRHDFAQVLALTASRQEVAETLGHNRDSVVAHYVAAK